MVDTPGIRQFQLWDVIAEEVAGYFRDLRPYVSLCRFPDCTHTHEDDCAVKDAVADGRLDERRYESYCHLFAGEMDDEPCERMELSTSRSWNPGGLEPSCTN